MADNNAENDLNRRLKERAALVQECEDLEGEIASLRVAYEQYFLGIDRRPPNDQHTALKKRLDKLKSSSVRQTAQKFRIQSLSTKYATYERLWARTLKEIEDGTYKRDLFKAKLRVQKAAKPGDKKQVEEIEEVDEVMDAPEPAPVAAPARVASLEMAAVKPPATPGAPAVAPAAGVPLGGPPRVTGSGLPAITPVAASSSGLPAVAPVRPASAGVPLGAKSSPGLPAVSGSGAKTSPGGMAAISARPTNPNAPAVRPPTSPGVPRAAPPAAASSGEVSDAKMRAVYDAFVTAKKRCQEDVSKLSYESVSANLRKQVPELLKKHNASGVDFKVVIKDGKAVLKAVPK